MPNLCTYRDCTSCMACFNACPFDAISMVETSLAEKVPSVDVKKCRECGMCEKVCPILNRPNLNHPHTALALYSRRKDDCATCSSGGAATVLSRVIIERGGNVYGATAADGAPRFIRISSLDELELLKGSKYVYCNPDKIYTQVRNDLRQGNTCLFIGLPCNVAGLLNFLQKKYDKLITVDLICHGAPPTKYLVQHLASNIPANSDITNITFRGKYDFNTTVWKGESILYQQNRYEDKYFLAFMKGITFRRSCYHCKFACSKRVADITLGDFWGLASDALDGYKGKISLALLNTPKGSQVFETCKELFNWEYRNVEEAFAGNDQLRRPCSYSESAFVFHNVFERTHSVAAAFDAAGISSLVTRNKWRRWALALPKMFLTIFK